MVYRIAWVTGLLLSVLGTTQLCAQSGVRWQREAREFGWLTDYANGIREAKASGRPIMLLFRCVP